MKNYQTHTTASEHYNEAAALQALLRAANQAISADCERLEADLDAVESFTININGQSIAFIVGGPQVEALYSFVQHIANENMHSVDLDSLTVTGNL